MKRPFLVSGLLFVAVAVFAGCGAGTSTSNPTPVGPGGTSPITPPTAATPSPTPSPTPVPGTTAIPGSTAIVYHPVANGDTTQTTGTLLTTYQRADTQPLGTGQTPAPEPTQTQFETVMQTTTVDNPGGTFNGNSANVDFHTVETDHETAPTSQTYSDTLDDYFVFSNNIYSGNFSNLGYTSTDNSGYVVTYTFGSGNGLVDELPEVAGATFTNTAAATIATSYTNNETSNATYAVDGTYNETINYPNVNASGPTTTQTIVANLDGSATINTPFVGTVFEGNEEFAFSAPSAAGSSGTITETTTQYPETGASPSATPSSTSTAIPNWIPTGYAGSALSTETDTDMGATNLPTAACPVPASFASTANELQQVINAVDPALGTFETTTTDTYVIPNVGPACVSIADTQTVYYDYSGQSGFSIFSGTPQQITTVNETVYLTAQELQSSARKSATARTTAARSFAGRVGVAQARIATVRRKQRTQRLQYLITHGAARSRDGQSRGMH